MSKLNNIQVKRIDNRLLILATSFTSSTQLLDMPGGSYAATDTKVDLSKLADGEYDFTLIGINAGGDFAFDVDVTLDGTTKKIGVARANPENTKISYEGLERLSLKPDTNRVIWKHTFRATVKK